MYTKNIEMMCIVRKEDFQKKSVFQLLKIIGNIPNN